MNRDTERFIDGGAGVPRTRGDEPLYQWLLTNYANVFPAPAGMNRTGEWTLQCKCGVPRTRGDEPKPPG